MPPEPEPVEPGTDWRAPKRHRTKGVKEETWRRLSAGDQVNPHDLAEELGCAHTSVFTAISNFRQNIATLKVHKIGHKSFYQIDEAALRRLGDERLPVPVKRTRKGDVPDFDSTLLVSGINRDPNTQGVFVVLYDPTSGRTWIADIRGGAE